MGNTDNKNIFNNNSFFSTGKVTNEANISINNPISIPTKSKYINDFDSELIIENIDKKTTNRAVKINLKISTIEKNLAKIKEELDLIKLLNLEKDEKKKIELTKLHQTLTEKLLKLKTERKKFGVIYSIFYFIEEKFSFIKTYRIKYYIKKYDKIIYDYFKLKASKLSRIKW